MVPKCRGDYAEKKTKVNLCNGNKLLEQKNYFKFFTAKESLLLGSTSFLNIYIYIDVITFIKSMKH